MVIGGFDAKDRGEQLTVAYDARFLQPKTRHWGVSVVIENIVERLADEFNFVGVSHKFTVSGNNGNIKFWPSFGFANKLIFEVSPWWVRDMDLYWATAHFLPQFTRHPSVLTVYDLLLLNQAEERKFASLLAGRFRSSLARATKIIAISKTTADDLIAELPELKAKIEVVHLGYEASDTRIDTAVPEIEIPSSPYAVMLGCHRPRKNLGLALTTISELRKKGIQIELLITGDVHPSFRKMLSDSPGGVQELGILPKQEIFSLLRNAACLLYPSRYEGFGLPLLEAMAAGCPVIALDIPINREIAGDAAFLLPDKPSEWVSVCNQLLKNDALRAEAREKGLKNLARFSWEKAAESYCQIFKEVARSAL